MEIKVFLYGAILAADCEMARDEARAINLSLDERVKTRTADLVMALERPGILLGEVTHRVANSLQLVAVRLRMQTDSVADPAAEMLYLKRKRGSTESR